MGGVVDAVGVAVLEGEEYGLVDSKYQIFNLNTIIPPMITLIYDIECHPAFGDMSRTITQTLLNLRCLISA
jgi:hypothetical protein